MRVSVDAGALNMVLSMLRRNAERHNAPVLAEAADELEKTIQPIEDENNKEQSDFLKINSSELYMILLLARTGAMESGDFTRFNVLFEKLKSNNTQFDTTFKRLEA